MEQLLLFHFLEQLTRDAGIETEQVDRNMQVHKPFFILRRTESLVPMHVARQDMRNDGTILCALTGHQDIPGCKTRLCSINRATTEHKLHHKMKTTSVSTLVLFTIILSVSVNAELFDDSELERSLRNAVLSFKSKFRVTDVTRF